MDESVVSQAVKSELRTRLEGSGKEIAGAKNKQVDPYIHPYPYIDPHTYTLTYTFHRPLYRPLHTIHKEQTG